MFAILWLYVVYFPFFLLLQQHLLIYHFHFQTGLALKYYKIYHLCLQYYYYLLYIFLFSCCVSNSFWSISFNIKRAWLWSEIENLSLKLIQALSRLYLLPSPFPIREGLFEIYFVKIPVMSNNITFISQKVHSLWSYIQKIESWHYNWHHG